MGAGSARRREWVAGNTAIGLVKGGSFLCALNYCANFRPAAFQAQEQNLPASHIGFRVVYPQINAASGSPPTDAITAGLREPNSNIRT
ncbi:MAG TPA: SUMF1/EgtB/PvdO family nonheme iron enzyme [Sphingomonas sp.]